jgi:phosphoribulokinase
MSKIHPIISVTGSSDAGTSSMKTAFQHIFFREKIDALIVEGDSFHRYTREEMNKLIQNADKEGKNFSHFGPESNLFANLEELFKNYNDNGSGHFRHYIQSEDHAKQLGYIQSPGTFTEWIEIPNNTDLLLYEGLHGALVDEHNNILQYPDLKIGVVPIVNLEWIQKLHTDIKQKGYCQIDVTKTILRRMDDYINYIMPQFTLTDINFQRVPVVDTSNPFSSRDIPTLDESMVVIRFKDPQKFNIDFPYLLAMVQGSFISRRNTLVVPGGKQALAMEIILAPIIKNLIKKKQMDKI